MRTYSISIRIIDMNTEETYIDPFTNEESVGEKKESHEELNVCISCEG